MRHEDIMLAQDEEKGKVYAKINDLFLYIVGQSYKPMEQW